MELPNTIIYRMTKPPITIPDEETLIKGDACLYLQIPWQTPDSIFFLDSQLTKDDVVVEIGAGGSTLFLAHRCKTVWCIETNESRANKVLKDLERNDLDNVTIMVVERNDVINWAESLATKATVISVDPQGDHNRSAILNQLLRGNPRMIVLDNYAHEGIFPDHYNKDWSVHYNVFDFNHPRWAGAGTRILIRK